MKRVSAADPIEEQLRRCICGAWVLGRDLCDLCFLHAKGAKS